MNFYKTGYAAFIKDASEEEVYRTDVYNTREECLKIAWQSLAKIYDKLIEPYVEVKFISIPIPEETEGKICGE